MFRAEFTSRSWLSPHSEHTHSLIPSAPIPFGLLLGIHPQHEHIWVVKFSSTSKNNAECLLAL